MWWSLVILAVVLISAYFAIEHKRDFKFKHSPVVWYIATMWVMLILMVTVYPFMALYWISVFLYTLVKEKLPGGMLRGKAWTHNGSPFLMGREYYFWISDCGFKFNAKGECEVDDRYGPDPDLELKVPYCDLDSIPRMYAVPYAALGVGDHGIAFLTRTIKVPSKV